MGLQHNLLNALGQFLLHASSGFIGLSGSRLCNGMADFDKQI